MHRPQLGSKRSPGAGSGRAITSSNTSARNVNANPRTLTKTESPMAELILTEEERAAATWFELDDATIGKIVKKQALAIMNKSEEMQRVTTMSAAMLLCGFAAEANAAEMTQEIRGFTQGGQEFGDWKVTVKRLPEGANLDQPSRHPTLDECKAAGQGPGFPH